MSSLSRTGIAGGLGVGVGTANKRMNSVLFQLVALIWEEEINGLLETSTTANFSPGALPRVSTAPCCTDQACCVLVLGGGRGIGRSEKQDASPASWKGRMGIDKVIQDLRNVVA